MDERFLEVLDDDGRTRWRLDAAFLRSNWTCIWGEGCQGIHDRLRPELHDGCCSVGVELVDVAEAMTIAALGASIDPARFAHAAQAPYVHERGGRWSTRVIDGACVFFNAPHADAPTGCALHHAAHDAGEDPIDWKPQTCTRLPIRVEEQTDEPTGCVEVTVRAWTRDDWGPGGATMAWWCTEAVEAHRGTRPVHETLEGELRVLFGDALYERVREVLHRDGNGAAPL